LAVANPIAASFPVAVRQTLALEVTKP
jgi:hypothetical protein